MAESGYISKTKYINGTDLKWQYRATNAAINGGFVRTTMGPFGRSNQSFVNTDIEKVR